MWTAKNRGRYDRSKLRYPSDLTDVRVRGSLQTLVNVFTYVLWAFAYRNCWRSNQRGQQQGGQYRAIRSEGHHAMSGIRRTECYATSPDMA